VCVGLSKDYLFSFSRVYFTSLCWCFPSIIFCMAGFMERCVNLVLSWNTLVSPSMVIENFSGYSILGCHLCSLRVCMTSAQNLLAFIVSGEKSGVILIALPLYVTRPFSPACFQYSFFVLCIW
jgi:hypothetical protein